MNDTFECPKCGRAVAFQSSITVFAVCPCCRAIVVRHDVDVEAIGEAAALLPDLSPLQLGTQGEYEGQAFTLLGRVRLSYDEGSWTEWFAEFADGQQAWVAEAQGFFMVSFAADSSPGPLEEGALRLGQKLVIAEQSYRVTDRKQTTCVGSEGELPFAAPPGRQALSIDLTGPDGRYACVQFSEDGARLWIGHYARFDDLNFTNLRPVPGWSPEASEPQTGSATALNCPQCGGALTLRGASLTMSATCASCGALLDTATPELRLIATAQAQQRMKPRIPLGRRGELFGVNYEVIGFQHVRDNESGWFEYLLFNPWQGFVWLVNYHTHWTFVRRLFESPEVVQTSLTKRMQGAKFAGKTYRVFAMSPVTTDYVLGEFYWKVTVGMAVEVTDFIKPPFILSRERYPNLEEETWSQGEYIQPAALQRAFNLDAPMPAPDGVYLNRPNPYTEHGRDLIWLVPVLALLLLGIQLVSIWHAANQQIFSGAYLYHAGATNPIVVTAPFTLPGGQQPVEFTFNAPVDNNWLEVGIDLVNAETQQPVASFAQGLEYYHGYDDGPWAEGDPTQSHLVPGVPAGKYCLAIEASADPAIKEMPFSITIIRDVPVWSNFWIGLGLLMLYPLYCGLRALLFEKSRWAESDYPPVTSSRGA